MQSQTITLSVDVNEVNALLQILGDTPAKLGLYPLLVKIKEQAEAQLNAGSAKEAPDA